MQNKFIFITVKCFFYFSCLILIFSFAQIFNGCGGSEEVEVTQRDKDSIEVYSKLQTSFAIYKQALSANESDNDAKANEDFEKALTILNEINTQIINAPENYFWKKDYSELARSIVEDYFATQSEIKESSLIFEFAKKVPVEYERIEQYSTADREPLPEGSDVPFIRNSYVDEYIAFFSNTERGRSFVDKCLYRSGKYFPLMRKILKFNNAPEELIYLSVQESGLSPTITSRAGAVGLWQFMPATGRSYGLDQDGYRDDRRDFEKATDAAARHLKDLYRTFDDWYLAFCAYNAGPGRVNSAIRKSGSRDFWSLRGYLPGETKNYVPSIIALSFVLRNPQEYGFESVEYGEQISFDRVNIQTAISLQKISELCESDIETIRELNPEILNDEIPEYDVPYQIRIPQDSYDKFAANYEKASDIDNSKSLEFAGNEKGVAGNITSVEYKVKNYDPEDINTIGSTAGKTKVTHKFKKKDALDAIAIYYSVRATDIRIWNNMPYGINPKPKQKIDIYLSEEKYKRLHGENKLQDEELTEVKQVSNSNKLENSEDKKEEDIITNKEPEENKVKSPLAIETPPKTETENSNQYTLSNTVQNPEQTEPVESNYSENLNEQSEVTESQTETTEEVAFVDNSGSETIVYEESTESKSSNRSKNKVHNKTYTVKSGDNLTSIAETEGVSVEELKEWNKIESDKILTGQKLKIYSSDVKFSVHTVTEGENLTLIAKKYNMTLDELKDCNDLKNDVIFSGQKLKVIQQEKSKQKSIVSKKFHKVKSGETLAMIAEKNGVSINDLRKWNKLKGDKILVGQELKLTP